MRLVKSGFCCLYLILTFTSVLSGQVNNSVRKFDQYGDIAFSEEIPRLDKFARQLKNEPKSKGYIIVYAGKRAHALEAPERLERAFRHLFYKRNIEERQLMTINGGFRKSQSTELYIITSAKGEPPITPTVPLSEVDFVEDTVSVSQSAIRKSVAEVLKMGVSKVEPRYPAIAKAAGVKDKVAVRVLIDEEGNVSDARVMTGHTLLQTESLKAARGWKFTPARQNGNPVKVIGILVFEFPPPEK